VKKLKFQFHTGTTKVQPLNNVGHPIIQQGESYLQSAKDGRDNEVAFFPSTGGAR
jgi:hypothetical protein